MKVKTEDLIRSCGNISCNLHVRLEEALSVATPGEAATIREFMTQARALDLKLNQFSAQLAKLREGKEQ